jgi:hypothetical protein
MNEFVITSQPVRPGGVDLDPQQKFSLRLVEVGDLTYIGKAKPGTANADSLWQIFRLDSATGLNIEWASGNAGFDKAWSDYLTLSYS